MFYTIGRSDWYNKWIIEQGSSFKKLGCSSDYVGGSAYFSYEDAERACPLGYSVYGLITTIDNIYQIGHNYHIKESCRIVLCNQ